MTHARTRVAYTSLIFQGFISSSRTPPSKRDKGTGWKFLRPSLVIAGFLTLVNNGLIFCLSNWAMRFHLLSCIVTSRYMHASTWLSSVVHGSFSAVKQAAAKIISGELAMERSDRPGGAFADSCRMSWIARADLSRLSSCAFLISATSQWMRGWGE